MARQSAQVALDWVREHEALLASTQREVWALAEVGLQEHRTSKLLADILEQHGFAVERGVAGMPTAFVATYGSGAPVIGLMAELDALPGLSQKAVPYREPLLEGAGGHGCGHSAYAVAALGGALAARAAMEAHGLPGTIKCFGCPAEEILVGKVFMVRDGVFAGVDACLGHHPGSFNGVSLASGHAANSAKFEFFGRASHAGGSPEQGISALDAVELMNMGVNYMREHVVPETRMHYVVEDGGHEPNVVPAYARSWYYVRAPRRDLVEQYYERVLRIADGADLMAGTTHRVRFLSGVHNGLQSHALAELVVAKMREIGAPTYSDDELAFARELGQSISPAEKRNALARSLLPGAMELVDVDLNRRIYDPFGAGMTGQGGSTDVAEVAWTTPTVEFATALFIVGAPGHSWQNTAITGTSVGDKSAIFAGKVMAAAAVDLLTQPDLLQRVREGWQEQMQGLTYRSPLPPDLEPPLDQFKPA